MIKAALTAAAITALSLPASPSLEPMQPCRSPAS
jgi:hypothetical protein